MRPNTLSIQAFGPFAGTEIIDFDQLGSNPLFLINGPTGSGKSSILDAICFALYGQTTGKEREAVQMRCDHAHDSLLTEILLEFTLGDSRYRIRRSPTQDKPKSRGEGYTIHQTEACLWQITSAGDTVLVPKKAQEATRLIEEKTGLNVEQFRQVMVLPQGKFRDFLMADSGQRESIFSKLFQTQIYKRLEDALKERATSIRKDVESLHNQIMGILQSADLSTEDDVKAELNTIQPDLDAADRVKNAASANLAKGEKKLEAGLQLDKAFIALENSQKQLERLQTKQPEFTDKNIILNRAIAAQKISHLQTQTIKLNQSIELISSDIKQCEARSVFQQDALDSSQQIFSNAEENIKSIDGIKQQLAELQKLLPKIDELAKASTDVTENEKLWRSADSDFDDSQKVLNTTKESITEFEKQRQTLRLQVLALPEKIKQRSELELQGKNRGKLDKLESDQEQLYKQQALHLNEFNQCESNLVQQDILVKTTEFNWHNNQAALLAAELKMGDPCPVCGSIEHPNLAVSTGQDGSKKVLEQEKLKLTTIQTQLSNVRNLLTQSETQLQINEQTIEESIVDLGTAHTQSTEELREHYRLVNNEVKSLEESQRILEQCEIELNSLATKLVDSTKHVESARERQQQTAQNYELARQQQFLIEQQLPENYRNPDHILNDIADLNNKITELTHVYDQSVQSRNNAQEELTKILSTLEQLHKQLIDRQKEQVDAESIWITSLASSDFTDTADFHSAVLPQHQQQSLQQEIQQYNDQMTGWIAALSQQKEQLKSETIPDLNKLKKLRDDLQIENENALTVWKQIDQRVQQLKGIQTKLDIAHKTNEVLEKEYKIYGTLSDVANGQTGNKISLQRFVLSVLLDDVLVEASHRLNTMSKGRYQLLRKEDRSKGNKASGLELEVEDAYTGKTRSVATLSGGESFMAALSLALGLSDVVQAYAGGIKLDTLFIDEGFGSLDQESLDLAIKSLIDLQATGRMIGIISHVSELREQMPLKIDVLSSVSGSRIG